MLFYDFEKIFGRLDRIFRAVPFDAIIENLVLYPN